MRRLNELLSLLKRVESDFAQRVEILGGKTDIAEVELMRDIRAALTRPKPTTKREKDE